MAKGLDRIKRMLKNRGKEINRDANRLVKKVAMDGVVVAKTKAPSAFGKLRMGINSKDTYLKSVVNSQMPYSVYVEFGTGKKVHIPSYTPKPLLEAAKAMRGKKGGNFDQFMSSLRKWARLKGIPQECVFIIAMSILKKGVEPQPFMRPAYIASRKALIKGLKTL